MWQYGLRVELAEDREEDDAVRGEVAHIAESQSIAENGGMINDMRRKIDRMP